MITTKALLYIADLNLSDEELNWLTNDLFWIKRNRSLFVSLQVYTSFNGEFQITIQIEGEQIIVKFHNWLSNSIEQKKITPKTFQKLINSIEDINFTKVYFENCNFCGVDGYRAILTISKGSYATSVTVCSPNKTKEPSETNKFIKVIKTMCKMMSVEIKL